MIDKDYASLELSTTLYERQINFATDYCRLSVSNEMLEKGKLLRFSEAHHLALLHLIPAPTLYEVQKWLRDTHKIHIEINITDKDNKSEQIFWNFRLYCYNEDIKNMPVFFGNYNSYEEALDNGIRKAIEIITI